MKEKEENRRKKKVPCVPFTFKSHWNARSPAPAPSNQTHILSQACFNTLNAHNCVSISPVNNWISCLLWWLCNRYSFLFLVLSQSYDDQTFNKNTSLKNVCASQWHVADDCLGHDITRSVGTFIKLYLKKLKLIHTNTAILQYSISAK